MEALEIISRRARFIARKGLPASLLRRLPLFRMALKSPYFFRFRDLWNYDPFLGWTSPHLQVISQEDQWLILEIDGIRFFWPREYDTADLPWLYHEVFTPPEKNPAAYETGPVKIRPGDMVIDAGACEGFFTAYALARGANVLAVEPIKLLCDALERTFHDEINQGRVQVLHGCLGDCNGEARININTKSVCETAMCATAIDPNGGELVSVYTVDSILEKGLIPDIRLIKMDIEGAEVKALIGSKKTLAQKKPQLAIAVYHELNNARLSRDVVLAAHPGYRVRFRGIYAFDNCIPRPFTLLAT